jgi:hypothetical protein
MTPSPEIRTFAIAADDRGSLVPIEFSDVPFTVRRAFAVTGPPGGATRGNHIVPCMQLLCLVAGAVTVQVGHDDSPLSEPARLEHPGQSVLLTPGTFVRYTLADASSILLVLAEEPFSGTSPE